MSCLAKAQVRKKQFIGENYMYINSLFNLILIASVTLLLSACGGGSSDNLPSTPTNESVKTTSYKVEYIPVTSAIMGKSTYKIKLTNVNDGKAVPGKTISLMPKMYMSNNTSHATPLETITDNGDGTYSGVIYYVMASTAGDTWELKFTIDGEVAIFNPVVATGGTSTSTMLVKLKGINDKIAGMTMSAPAVARTYQLFNEGMSATSVKLFISAVDDGMMMKFPAVSKGSTLHNEMNVARTVASMTVDASTDNGSTWSSLTDNSGGHWSVSGMTGLAAGGTVKIRVTIDGEQKTSDGTTAVPGTNDFATFFVVAGL